MQLSIEQESGYRSPPSCNSKPNIPKGSAFIFLSLLILFISCTKEAEDTDDLFKRMESQQTGINFTNSIDYQPGFNILDYLYFYDGGGVAIGDFNNDNLMDIYFTANQEPNKLYLNNGDFTFTDITRKANVAGNKNGWSTGVTTGDVNGDGLLDIYVCQVNYRNKEGHNLLFINNGDSTFTEKAEEYGLDFKGFSTQAAFFDYDRDGDLDLYLLNHSVHSTRSYGNIKKRETEDPRAGDKLYRNDGAHFTDVTEQAGIYSSALGYGLGLAISDINKDGWPDIYIGNDFHENDYLYINNGDGTFTEKLEQVIGHTSQASMGNDIADINNDGQPDIVSLDMMPENRAVYQKSGGPDPDRIERIKRDLGYAPQVTRNTMQLHRGFDRAGSPLFSEIGAYAGIYATDWSWASLLADLDNDGRKDLYVTNGIVRRPNDLDYISIVSNQQTQKRLQKRGSDFEREVIRQMPILEIPNYAFHNNGNLTFTNRAKKWGLNTPSISNGAAYGDLDNDGDLDLVVNNINKPAFIYNNRSDTMHNRHYLKVELDGDRKNSTGIGSKVVIKTDGKTYYREQTPTRGFQSSVSHVLHFGLDGNINKVDSLLVVWPDNRFELRRNVEVDQRLVVHQKEARATYSFEEKGIRDPVLSRVTSRIDVSYKHRENVYSDFKRQPLIPHKLSTRGPALTVGDVNGDNLEDFYAGGARGQAGKLYIQNQSGNFEAGENRTFRLDWGRENVDAVFVDVDGDGAQDLYIVNGGGGEFSVRDDELRDRLYMNKGHGTFTPAEGRLPTFYADGSCVAAADYDNDGDVDLFVGSRAIPGQYGKSPRSYLLENNGDGSFRDITRQKAPELLDLGMVTDAVWADINDDALLELIIVGEWMPVTVLQNTGDEFKNITDSLGLTKTGGWWKSVLAEDFDDDGDVDLVAGNLGKNTILKASRENPLKLYLNDFDNNGTTDPIIAQNYDGTYYPWARRDEILDQLPGLKEKVPSYEKYAEMSLEQLFGSGKLQKSTLKQVFTFETSYFENLNEKGFKRIALPGKLQFTPIKSLLSGDFDNDDKTDILAKGNLFGSDTKQGRYDAGYGFLLNGDGNGDFEYIPGKKSGFIVHGEGRALKKIQTRGDKEIIAVALNDTTLQFFEAGIK